MALKKFCTVTTVGNKNVKVASRKEGTCSATPVAENEFSSSSGMSSDKPFHIYANQTQEEVGQGYSATLGDVARTLLVENSVSGVEAKAVNEGQSSAAPVSNPEKWSHEAIVARSNVRPVRREKLNRAAN